MIWKLNDSTSWRGKVHLIFFALLRPAFVKLNLEKVVRFYFSARFCSLVAGSCIMDEDCESFFGSVSLSVSLDGALFKRLEGRVLIPELSSRAGHSSQGLRVIMKMRSLKWALNDIHSFRSWISFLLILHYNNRKSPLNINRKQENNHQVSCATWTKIQQAVMLKNTIFIYFGHVIFVKLYKNTVIFVCQIPTRAVMTTKIGNQEQYH